MEDIRHFETLGLEHITIVDIVKEVIGNFDIFIQIFFSRNIMGDHMTKLFEWSYRDDRIEVLWCQEHDYIEILGLTRAERDAIREWQEANEREFYS